MALGPVVRTQLATEQSLHTWLVPRQFVKEEVERARDIDDARRHGMASAG